MTIQISQIIISIATIMFVIFNIIAVYKVQHFFSVTKVEIDQNFIIWKIIQNTTLYNKWWKKFIQLEGTKTHIKTDRSLEHLFTISVSLYMENKDKDHEKWIFSVRKKGNQNYLIIKKQFVSNSSWKMFLKRYYLDNLEFRQLKKDLLKAYTNIYNNVEASDYSTE